MISRKERRIQKALGTAGSMPPTIYKRMQYWVYLHITARTHKWRMSSLWQWLAFKLPKSLVYHATIRMWAHATTCPSGRKEIASDTTIANAITRWEKE